MEVGIRSPVMELVVVVEQLRGANGTPRTQVELVEQVQQRSINGTSKLASMLVVEVEVSNWSSGGQVVAGGGGAR